MATAVAKITEHLISTCCGGGGKFGDNFGTATEENKNNNNSKVDPKFKKTFLNQQMKFEFTDWKKLPLKARDAAKNIGYNEESWNNSETVDVTWKSWWDLSDDEKASLEVLGWEETGWEYQYTETAWNDLPELQQKAAKIAGYDEHTWDEEGYVENLDKSWDDLKKFEQEALCVMGWTQTKWDYGEE